VNGCTAGFFVSGKMQMANGNIAITVLIENTAQKGLKSEHGISYFIQTPQSNIVFDTGQSCSFIKNAEKLNIPVHSADKIVLSHGHYDHTGGLNALLDVLAKPAEIYLHPQALKPKFKSVLKKFHKDIGCRIDPEVLRNHKKTKEIIYTESPTKIDNYITATGYVPRKSSFETTPPDFLLSTETKQQDAINDDQSLFFESKNGLVIILGCCHAGIVNTIEYIKTLTENLPFNAVFGGMHLVNADKERIDASIRAFQEYKFDKIAPAHCSGKNACRAFERIFPDEFFQIPAGTRMDFSL
jgi:7,8-dihydropterin-6-yl-methyl-4-(beta-D-ribofuranosyl)aminobenzene 5'-phosphate synthase